MPNRRKKPRKSSHALPKGWQLVLPAFCFRCSRRSAAAAQGQTQRVASRRMPPVIGFGQLIAEGVFLRLAPFGVQFVHSLNLVRK